MKMVGWRFSTLVILISVWQGTFADPYEDMDISDMRGARGEGRGRPSSEEMAARRERFEQRRREIEESAGMDLDGGPSRPRDEDLDARRQRFEERRREIEESGGRKGDGPDGFRDHDHGIFNAEQQERLNALETRKAELNERRGKDENQFRGGNMNPEDFFNEESSTDRRKDRRDKLERRRRDYPRGEGGDLPGGLPDGLQHPHHHDFMNPEDEEFFNAHNSQRLFDSAASAASISRDERRKMRHRDREMSSNPRVQEAQERLKKARARRNEKAISKIDKRVDRISRHAERQNFDDEKLAMIKAELNAIRNDEPSPNEDSESYVIDGEEEELSEEEKLNDRVEDRLERLRKVEYEVLGHSDPQGHRDFRADFGHRDKGRGTFNGGDL